MDGRMSVQADALRGLRAEVGGWVMGLFRKGRRRLSDAARSVVWLIKADPDGWLIDRFCAVHSGSRVGVWIANEDYGLKFYYDISKTDLRVPHVLNGTPVEVPPEERKIVWEAIKP